MTEARVIRLRNPRTGQNDGELSMATLADVQQAAQQLRAAQVEWAAQGVAARCHALEMFADALDRHRHALINALLQDTGRWHESVMEVDACIASARRWAQDAAVCLAEPAAKPGNVPFVQVRQCFVPVALVGVISPWNFPLLLTLIDALPALAAGSAVLAKPSEVTPRFVAPLRLVLAEVPALAAVLALLIGDGEVGTQVVEAVDLVCFTGSVRSGRRVGEACAKRFIPSFLELGGKDPAIVLAGADIERAARAICWAGFVNAGQSCMSIERVYVEAAVAEEFIAALVRHAERLWLAYPTALDGQIGPIISAAQIEVVGEHLRDAKALGARALVGGELLVRGGGTYCPPTVLVDVNGDMQVIREETFASILPVITVADARAAVEAANRSDFGLSAAVFAGSIADAEAVGRQLLAGAISINDAALTSVIHSGEKQSFKLSGLGGSRMGPASIRRFVRQQALLINPGVDDPWWF